MAMIHLTNGFTVIPEGRYTFTIESYIYKEAFGKLEITLKTPEGHTHVERYSFLKPDGTNNDRARDVFSFFARKALGTSAYEDIDPAWLVGKRIEATVEHDVKTNTKDPTKTVTYVKLKNIETVDIPEVENVTAEVPFSLDSFLNQ